MIGLWLNLPPIWMVVSLVIGLSAWDLDAFGRRLRPHTPTDQTRELGRRHLWRLLVVDIVSLCLALLALQVRLNLTLGAAIGLGLLAVLGLSRLLVYLRDQRS